MQTWLPTILRAVFLNLDSIKLESKIFTDSLDLTASVANPDLQTRLQSQLSWKDQIKIYLANWELAIKDQAMETSVTINH